MWLFGFWFLVAGFLRFFRSSARRDFGQSLLFKTRLPDHVKETYYVEWYDATAVVDSGKCVLFSPRLQEGTTGLVQMTSTFVTLLLLYTLCISVAAARQAIANGVAECESEYVTVAPTDHPFEFIRGCYRKSRYLTALHSQVYTNKDGDIEGTTYGILKAPVSSARVAAVRRLNRAIVGSLLLERGGDHSGHSILGIAIFFGGFSFSLEHHYSTFLPWIDPLLDGLERRGEHLHCC